MTWQSREVRSTRDGQIDLGRTYSHDDDRAAYGYAEVESSVERKAQMVVGSDDTLTVWLNGKQVYDFADRRGFSPDDDKVRRDACVRERTDPDSLRQPRRPVAVFGRRDGSGRLRFLERCRQATPSIPRPTARSRSKGRGMPARGRQLFSDLKGLACVKCHAVGKEGGAVGPELSTVGAKYPRDELIASVLYPSAKISSGFEPATFALSDGRVVTGIVRNETPKLGRDPGRRGQAGPARQGPDRRAEAERRLADAQRPGPGFEPARFRGPDRVSRDPEECRRQNQMKPVRSRPACRRGRTTS